MSLLNALQQYVYLHIIYTGPAKIDHGFLDTEHSRLEKAFRLKYGNAVRLTNKVRVEKNWMILVRSNESNFPCSLINSVNENRFLMDTLTTSLWATWSSGRPLVSTCSGEGAG